MVELIVSHPVQRASGGQAYSLLSREDSIDRSTLESSRVPSSPTQVGTKMIFVSMTKQLSKTQYYPLSYLFTVVGANVPIVRFGIRYVKMTSIMMCQFSFKS